MVGSDYEHVARGGDRPRKRNVTVYDADGRRLGTYPILFDNGEYLLTWRDNKFPVRKGEQGQEKGRFYLTRQEDAKKLES